MRNGKVVKGHAARYTGRMYGTYVGAKLAGQRFGRLIVTKIADRRGNKLYWFCTCDCGREIIAYQADLRKGRVRSCDNPACVAKSKMEKKWVDYSLLAGKTE